MLPAVYCQQSVQCSSLIFYQDSEDTKKQLKADRKKNKERLNELYGQKHGTIFHLFTNFTYQKKKTIIIKSFDI